MPDPPLHILTYRPAFLLCVGGQDRYHQLTIGAHCVKVLFFKENINTEVFKLPDRFKQRDRVSGEARNALGYDHVDFSGPAISDHPLELCSSVPSSGYRLIGINPGILPTRMVLNQLAVVAYLS